MVDTLVPDYVDAKKIFAQHALISGVVPISRFSRFCELLADSSGDLKVSLQFHLDENHRRVIAGEIDTTVSVICQRCLEPAHIHLVDSFKLAIVESEAQVAKLPGTLDPWMATDIKLVIADFLEEQLILTMPIVSYHSEGCNAAIPESAAGITDRQRDKEDVRDGSPFAILKQLKEPR